MGCACKTKVKPSQEIGKESIENIEENSKVSRIFGYILRFFFISNILSRFGSVYTTSNHLDVIYYISFK